MTLVKLPGTMYRNPHEIHRIEHDPQCPDGTLEHGSKSDIERDSLLKEYLSSATRFLNAAFRHVHVRPTGKTIFTVPIALAVSKQNEFLHGETSARTLAGLQAAKTAKRLLRLVRSY